MRSLILAAALAVPLAIPAQAEEPVRPWVELHPAQLEMPTFEERRIDGYRMLAITGGALGGAVLTNMVVGGVVAPVVLGGTLGTLEGIGGAFMVVHGAAVVAGGVAGGFLGDWLYRQ